MSLADVAINQGFTTQQEVDLVRAGWIKFPASRPVENTKIKTLVDGVEKSGISIKTKRTPPENYSGIALKVNGVTYDSNHLIWWKEITQK